MNRIKLLLFLLFIPFIAHTRQVFKGEAPWNLTRQLTQASYDVTIIQSMLTAGNFTISSPGVYGLAQPIIGTITIASNNVVADLNEKQLTGSVIVNTGLSFVTIKNGLISSATMQGIVVNSGCRVIDVQNVEITDCLQDGIFINQSRSCHIESCSFNSNSTGITITNCSDINIHKTQALNNKNAGFSLIGSSTNSLLSCQAINNGVSGAGNIFGFVSTNGIGNIFEECIANGTNSLIATSTNNISAGFALLGTEQCSKIIDSESGNTASGGIPYGIYLQQSTTPTVSTTPFGSALVEVTVINTGDNGGSVSWSPDGCFLANTHGTQFDIYRLVNSNSLQLVNSVTGNLAAYLSIDWSFDGNFLVLSTPNGTVDFYRFDLATLKAVFYLVFQSLILLVLMYDGLIILTILFMVQPCLILGY